MAAENKQAILVSQIADGVYVKVSPEFFKIGDLLAKLTVTVNAISARLETLESLHQGGGAAVKRTVRSANGAKPAAGSKKAPAKAAADSSDPLHKVTNALLFFRWMLKTDYEESRSVWGTEENLVNADGDPTVSGKDKVKNEAEYWSAVGAYLWKNTLTEDDKSQIRGTFEKVKEEQARSQADPPLQEEDQ